MGTFLEIATLGTYFKRAEEAVERKLFGGT
jgi:hypothetical protein